MSVCNCVLVSEEKDAPTTCHVTMKLTHRSHLEGNTQIYTHLDMMLLLVVKNIYSIETTYKRARRSEHKMKNIGEMSAVDCLSASGAYVF